MKFESTFCRQMSLKMLLLVLATLTHAATAQSSVADRSAIPTAPIQRQIWSRLAQLNDGLNSWVKTNGTPWSPNVESEFQAYQILIDKLETDYRSAPTQMTHEIKQHLEVARLVYETSLDTHGLFNSLIARLKMPSARRLNPVQPNLSLLDYAQANERSQLALNVFLSELVAHINRLNKDILKLVNGADNFEDLEQRSLHLRTLLSQVSQKMNAAANYAAVVVQDSTIRKRDQLERKVMDLARDTKKVLQDIQDYEDGVNLAHEPYESILGFVPRAQLEAIVTNQKRLERSQLIDIYRDAVKTQALLTVSALNAKIESLSEVRGGLASRAQAEVLYRRAQIRSIDGPALNRRDFSSAQQDSNRRSVDRRMWEVFLADSGIGYERRPEHTCAASLIRAATSHELEPALQDLSTKQAQERRSRASGF